MTIVNRAGRRHYLNIGTAEAPVWTPVGDGFTEFSEGKHPIRYSRRYIHESTHRVDVTGYAPAVDYAFEVFTDNPAAGLLRQITDTEQTGAGARVELCTVDFFEDIGIQDVYPAIRRTYTVVPDRCGDGTDMLVYTGTLKAFSAPIRGSFVPATGTFIV